MENDNNALLGWALYLAALGWPVFPLRPGSKQPTGHRAADCPGTGACTGGHLTPERRATTDSDTITRAWTTGAWNIGVATGPAGLVVVDLDQPKPGDPGPDGATALAELAVRRGGPIPPTYTVDTPSGGRHLYYLAPAGTDLRSTAGHVASCVDTRAWGGYVVGPGSVTPGGAYELADDTDPVELPGWLVQVCVERPPTANSAPLQIRATNPTRYGSAALTGECDRVRSAEPGTYNDVLSRAAYTIGRKVGGGLVDHATARADLIAAGETLVSAKRWPRTAAEVVRVVDAGLSAGAANPVTRRGEAA